MNLERCKECGRLHFCCKSEGKEKKEILTPAVKTRSRIKRLEAQLQDPTLSEGGRAMLESVIDGLMDRNQIDPLAYPPRFSEEFSDQGEPDDSK